MYAIITKSSSLLFAQVNFRDEKLLKKFGKHLQAVRKQKGLTQEDLAYQSNISLSQIARIETGRINPTLCTLVEISKTIDVDLKDLVNF
ncbi:MAG: helix-turn-helix domain-containing protein [Bacteroidota bacterium]|jgi:transcriptional regulator with XRE-family HTH domain|nr:helix-turn-helix transcriptional regulator [Cytophagales bacterium]MCA6430799.1 helix-turn-helix transcriptional regulator [Cytophagales bacterium]MCE2956021.1 helix-turn-helix domain-containing protein [Flammeovirgaceae bacterium]MCZ8069098.1 helix-turn-helix transcriptional regulator [Cytophagales bacterium]